MHILIWVVSVWLNGPEAFGSYFTTEVPRLRGANENICTKALSRRWPVRLSPLSALSLEQSDKRARLKPLIRDINARLDAAGLTPASERALAEAKNILRQPPFVALAGPRLIRVLPAFAGRGVLLSVRDLNTADEPWTIMLDSTDVIYPKAGSLSGDFLALTDPTERLLDVVDLEARRTILRVRPSPAVESVVGHAYGVHAAFSPEGPYLTVSQPDRIEVYNLSTSPPHIVVEKSFPITAVDPEAEDLPAGFRGRAEYLAQSEYLMVWYHHHPPLLISPRQRWSSEVETSGGQIHGEFGQLSLGGVAYVAHANGVIDLIDTRLGRLLRSLDARVHSIYRFADSPSGRYLAVSLNVDDGILVFDLASRSKNPRYKLDIPSGAGELIGFANERTIIGGDRDLFEAYSLELP